MMSNNVVGFDVAFTIESLYKRHQSHRFTHVFILLLGNTNDQSQASRKKANTKIKEERDGIRKIQMAGKITAENLFTDFFLVLAQMPF